MIIKFFSNILENCVLREILKLSLDNLKMPHLKRKSCVPIKVVLPGTIHREYSKMKIIKSDVNFSHKNLTSRKKNLYTAKFAS